jgi:hypothetical protein
MLLLEFTSDTGEDIGEINCSVYIPPISRMIIRRFAPIIKGMLRDTQKITLLKRATRNLSQRSHKAPAVMSHLKFTYNRKHPFQRGYWEGKYRDDFESRPL